MTASSRVSGSSEVAVDACRCGHGLDAHYRSRGVCRLVLCPCNAYLRAPREVRLPDADDHRPE